MSKTANIIGRYKSERFDKLIYNRLPDGWRIINTFKSHEGFHMISNWKGVYSGGETAFLPDKKYELANVIYSITDAPIKYDSLSVFANLGGVSILVEYQDKKMAIGVVDDIIKASAYDGMKVVKLGNRLLVTCDYELYRSRA